MKKYLTTFALFLGISSVLFAEAQEWKSYTIENGKFNINLPGLPEESTETIKANFGDLPLHSLSYETEKLTFVVNMITYPVGFMDQKDPEALFDNIQTATLAGREGELIDTKNEKIQGFPGRQVRFQVKKTEQYYEIHLVLVKNRLYQIIAISSLTNQKDPDIRKFLTSFTLDEKAGQNELEDYLEKLGLEYEIDESGQYNFTLVFQDERSQLVFITPVQLDYDSKQYYDIWSPVAKFQGDIPAEIAGQLLYQNGQVEVGTYQVLNTNSGKLIVFSTKVASGTDVEIFKRMIIRISSIADDAEKHITKDDKY